MRSMLSDHVTGDVASSVLPNRLPPLRAVEIFALAARCGTFARTAKELRVTQSAISRQVKLLEEYLGLTLFIRHKRGLRLTPAAEALLPIVEESFTRLTRTCDSLRNEGQVLTLRMPPTFALRWFLPLLPSLRALMPDVDVRVSTDDSREPRFEDSDVDAAIIYGRGNWPGLEATHLMPERLTPVCSSEVAKRLTAPADLEHTPLLQCCPVQAWNRWLEGAKVGWMTSRLGQTFDTLELALSGAARSQGVALGDVNLLKESLRDGALVAPFDYILDQGVSYYLIYPSQREQLPKIRVLRSWLLTVAAATV